MKEIITLTVRAALKLCVLSKSKGAAIMSDFLLDIMDLFKAGLRDSSNSIFNKIRECVGIKMQQMGSERLPDYSVRDPELPPARKDSNGRMVVKAQDLSNNPVDTLRACRLWLTEERHPTFYDVAEAAAGYIVHQRNEIDRLRAESEKDNDELAALIADQSQDHDHGSYG